MHIFYIFYVFCSFPVSHTFEDDGSTSEMHKPKIRLTELPKETFTPIFFIFPLFLIPFLLLSLFPKNGDRGTHDVKDKPPQNGG